MGLVTADKKTEKKEMEASTVFVPGQLADNTAVGGADI